MTSKTHRALKATVVACFVISLLWIWYHWSAELECAEESEYSPSEIVQATQYLALVQIRQVARLESVRYDFNGIDYVAHLDEYVVTPLVEAKGQNGGDFSILSMDSDRPLDSLLMTWKPGDTMFANCNAVDTAELHRIGTGVERLSSPWSRARGLAAAAQPSVPQHIRDRMKDRVLMYFSDGGTFRYTFRSGSMCFYDEQGRAHNVSASKYWELIEKACK